MSDQMVIGFLFVSFLAVFLRCLVLERRVNRWREAAAAWKQFASQKELEAKTWEKAAHQHLQELHSLSHIQLSPHGRQN